MVFIVESGIPQKIEENRNAISNWEEVEKELLSQKPKVSPRFEAKFWSAYELYKLSEVGYPLVDLELTNEQWFFISEIKNWFEFYKIRRREKFDIDMQKQLHSFK